MRFASTVVGGVGRGYMKDRRRKGGAERGSSTEDAVLKTSRCFCKNYCLGKNTKAHSHELTCILAHMHPHTNS